MRFISDQAEIEKMLKEDSEMRTRSVGSVTRFAVLVLVLATVGCKHPAAVSPAAPAAPVAPPARPTVTLEATPTVVQRSQSSTLRWTSTNATSLMVAPGIGTVAPEGTTTVSPTDSITYTITATGPAGTAEASAHITVTTAAAPPESGGPSATLEELFNREVQDAYFDLDRADIRGDARAALMKTAQFLRSYPQIKVAVEGHCDERGSTEYNLALGDRRAQAAKDFLVSLGVPADRMQTVSYGKEKPFCTEHAEACWQQNRRAHFVLAK
jgi:peptidoglycan-associated lipoprotein